MITFFPSVCGRSGSKPHNHQVFIHHMALTLPVQMSHLHAWYCNSADWFSLLEPRLTLWWAPNQQRAEELSFKAVPCEGVRGVRTELGRPVAKIAPAGTEKRLGPLDSRGVANTDDLLNHAGA